MFGRIGLVALVLVMALPAAAQNAKPIADMRPDQAVLYIIRPKDPGAADRVAAYVYRETANAGAEVIAHTRGNAYTYAYLAPGRHFVFSPGSGAANIEVVPGEAYYLVSGVYHGFFLVDEETGREMIAEARNYLAQDPAQIEKGMRRASRFHAQAKELAETWHQPPHVPPLPRPADVSELAHVPRYTRMALELAEPVSSDRVEAGGRISFRVAEDARAGGVTWLAAGTPVDGVVIWVQSAGRAGQEGNLHIDVLTVQAIDGTSIPVIGQVVLSAKRRTAAMARAGLFGALAKGGELELEAGETFTFWTRDDAWVHP